MAEWILDAYKAVCRIAERSADFTSDDVWAVLSEAKGRDRGAVEAPLPDPRALGGAFRRAERAGFIVATERVRTSVRIECHHRPVRIWKSLIFRGAKKRAGKKAS